jgi:ribosomal protein L37AE/L43A
MGIRRQSSDAWQCETCRRYRNGAAIVLVLLAVTWLVG